MDTRRLLENNGDTLYLNSGIGFLWCPRDDNLSQTGSFFASVGQMGKGGFGGVTHNSKNTNESSGVKLPYSSKFVSTPESTFRVVGVPEVEVEEELVGGLKKKKKGGLKLKIKIGNPSLRRLISGAIAGAVSRTSVAPLETIRTHLMVGSCGHSSTEVFQDIMKTEGWTGLFRGNLVNVLRVAPSKAIELFAYETVKKSLAPKPGEQVKLRVPESFVAGAVAGISSTICMYPLELLKTRLTVQRGVYKNLVDAFVRIIKEEGPAELYRGLTPSLIGVIPYAATNYFAYDTLRKAYKKVLKKEDIGNIATLLIGSAAGAISSSATFPLEVARKHMQAGAINGRVYDNMLHALLSILEKEGVQGLYRGLGPSCIKIVPAAGISFMCYEACKKILVEKEDAES
uniref:adenine nucleotide transporter BT1, chloroplastic/mitochondrial-like n=1 Tax=Erigeron canadensis TaxID=72917 RepID=UPI001CB91B89|nr:adenine nucleotide transporter BT1, chloroplastic/mitochondrial-like [Erigeron canadensis]XP_043628483.1 adenine nucleotide transporter BT1, chloroplastic/mitochondrial-like [Erigeron canadensis]